jgi:hypothetical protein
MTADRSWLDSQEFLDRCRAIVEADKIGKEPTLEALAALKAAILEHAVWRPCELHPDIDPQTEWGCPECLTIELERLHVAPEPSTPPQAGQCSDSAPSNEGHAAGPAEGVFTPRTDAVAPHLNLSHRDMTSTAWGLRDLCRELERELRAQSPAMTEERAREILGSWIQPDNSLDFRTLDGDSILWKPSWRSAEISCVELTPTELRALASWMENMGRKG